MTLLIYKACEERRDKLDHIQRTSDDEDKIANTGKDLVEISMIIRELKYKADEVWGKRWLDYIRRISFVIVNRPLFSETLWSR